MGNNYNIKERDGSPSQKTIDSYLNWCDDNPPDYSADVKNFTADVKKKVKESLEQLRKEMQELLDSQVKPPLDDLKKKLAIYKPLIEPPTSPDACVEYCKSVVDYFKDPYTKCVELIIWWTQYGIACTTATTKMMSRIAALEAQLGAAVKDSLSEDTKSSPTSDSSVSSPTA